LQRTDFQSPPGQTVETLRHQCDALARLDRRDEAGGAVVFLYNLGRVLQLLEQINDPSVMLRVIGECVSDETFPGDLFQSDFPRPRQRMHRVHVYTDSVLLEFLKHETGCSHH